MDTQKRQATFTGSGVTSTPILAEEKDPTEASSRLFQENTSIELVSFLNAKPNTPAEALGLLQTRFFDLQSLGFKLILAGNRDNGKLYAILAWDGHALGVQDGHITLDGVAVLRLGKT